MEIFINDLNGEEITRLFYKKALQKANQKESRIGKVTKGNKLFVKWKDMIIHSIV